MNVPTNEISVNNLPEDSASLKAMLREVLAKLESVSTDQQREKRLAEQLRQRADDLYLENLRLQQELERYKKATYGPRADRLSMNQLAQMLLEFAEALEQKPINLEDLREAEPETEVRRVKRRKGRRALAHFERLEHVRKKYACPSCESEGENPQIEVAAKAETAIEKGFAGPGLLAFIVTSKFADYLPLYRLEDIFERQGFEISRATQSVWCRDVADVVEPLYQRMAERVRKSHVVATDDTVQPMLSPGQTQPARMWVYVGDEANPYNVFDFNLNRSREGPKEFLKDYTQVLLADAYGGYNGVVAGNAITRAGCWSHARRKFVEAEKSAPEIAREAVALMDALFAVERQAKDVAVAERLELRQKQSVPILAELHRKLLIWKQQLLPKHPMADAVNYTLGQWEALTVFTTDGAVPIDNNVSEREMKRVVLNRKNSLFVGNPRGGRTAAILASLTSSCRRHDMDPHLYFMQLL